MTVAECAARGATFLDERIPDWYNTVNPGTLDIAHAGNCVIGQLFGSYWKGIVALDLDSSDFEDGMCNRIGYGFSMMGVWGAERTESLTNAWREEIARRRLKSIESPSLELTAVH